MNTNFKAVGMSSTLGDLAMRSFDDPKDQLTFLKHLKLDKTPVAGADDGNMPLPYEVNLICQSWKARRPLQSPDTLRQLYTF